MKKKSNAIWSFYLLRLIWSQENQMISFSSSSDVSGTKCGCSGKGESEPWSMEWEEEGSVVAAGRQWCCTPLPPSALQPLQHHRKRQWWTKKPIYSRPSANTSPLVSARWTSASASRAACAHVIMLVSGLVREKERGRGAAEARRSLIHEEAARG